MKQAAEPIDANSATVPPCWNVCVDHQAAHAGLYRGIRDFARALSGGILSFDGRHTRQPRDPAEPVIRRVCCGGGWLSRDCHSINADARRTAETVAEDAAFLVVHSLFRAHCRWAWEWGQHHRRPYWVVPHGCLDPAGLSRRAGMKRLWMWRDGRRVFSDAEAVVFATRREMKKADTWMPPTGGGKGPDGHSPRRVVIPWPVDVPSLVGQANAREELRKRLDVPTEAPILLWVGRFHATKRPLEAIRAFAAANTLGSHFVVVGLDEAFTKADVQKAVPGEMADRIHVLGELRGAALAEAWLAADGYISLSAKENFGYTLADALAHGLPVILSPGHDLAHDLPRAGDGRLACGWLLPDNTHNAAVQAVSEWATMVGMRRGGGQTRELLRESTRSWVADNLAFDRFQDALRHLAAR